MKRGNLLAEPRAPGVGEVFEDLLVAQGFRLERIVSTGQSTPAGEWLEQREAEWVVLLSGAARLRFEGETELVMEPGDWVAIDPGRRHRVEWTDPTRTTVWLAVHYPAAEDGAAIP